VPVHPQQVSLRTTGGLIHVPLGVAVRLAVKLGVPEPHCAREKSAAKHTKNKSKSVFFIDQIFCKLLTEIRLLKLFYEKLLKTFRLFINVFYNKTHF
jgi:hypothetical protein